MPRFLKIEIRVSDNNEPIFGGETTVLLTDAEYNALNVAQLAKMVSNFALREGPFAEADAEFDIK